MKGGVKQYQFNTEKLEQIAEYISKLAQAGKLEVKTISQVIETLKNEEETR